ncbi:MAG: MFS transporter [Planctomycetaceae bacterium]|jgi:MFS family permease|nr:MFS transporter [Planctomycetaceae bacterium]
MLISFRTITITGFLAWFSAFFVLIFPAVELHSAVQELWKYPLIYSPEVFVNAHLADRITLFGFAIGFIFFGSLCDRVGRYNAMIMSLTCAPFCATICGYFADAWLFLILHFLVGVFVSGVLVSSTTLIFEAVPSAQRWRTINFVIVGGALGAILPFLFESIGWRSLYQIQLLPVFFVPIFWHWSDEPLLWKYAVRDKQRTNIANKKSAQKNSPSNNFGKLPDKTLRGKIGFRQFCISIINKLTNTYFFSLSDVLLNRQHLILPALFLTTFGMCGLAISLMSFGDGVRQRAYQSYDLDVRTALRVQNNEVVVDDIDAALMAYIIEKPLVLDLINLDESRIDLMPQVLRSYGYSRDDISGCVADGLFELVKQLRGERITKELVTERAVLRWNSKYGNGQSELDIPEPIRNRIKLKAGFFLTVGERTLNEILAQNQKGDGNKKRDLVSERRKTSEDKWKEWCNEFLSLWEGLLFVTENRYGEGEWCVERLKLSFLAGCLVCGLFGFIEFLFNKLRHGWTQRRIFCVMFAVLAMMAVTAVMLRQVKVPFILLEFYAFICGLVVVPFVTCYMTTIPAMFAAAHRGAAIGFCFGLPLFIVFQIIYVIPVPYIYYLIPICFVAGVFAIGIPARKKHFKQQPVKIDEQNSIEDSG